ncbi:MAG: hypothetical protein KKB20_07570 [Proteobacteria bacterium]|nr:hypothetical protein [Pseudomonadota bacterium]
MNLRRLFVLLGLGLALGLVPAAASAARSGDSEPRLWGDVEAFKAAAQQDGFTVQAGEFKEVPVVQLFCKGVLPSGYGYNSPTPALACFLPKAPGQKAENRMPWTFSLRPDEALVYIGRTPPEMKYFSYRSYLATRYFESEGRRRRVFASLGDTVNNLTVKTAGKARGPKGAFDRTVVVISTADRDIDKRVRRALRKAGFTASAMNTDVVPSALVRMGLEEHDDDFVFLHRIASPSDPAAGAEYLKNPGGLVLRLTPTSPPVPDPFPMPRLRARGTGRTEVHLLSALEDLRKAVMAKHTGLKAESLDTSVRLPEGLEAIQRGVDVLGEIRDTTYLRTDHFKLADNPGEFVIVYGVNHAASGKAVYANFNLYGATPVPGQEPVKGVVTEEMLGVGCVHDAQWPGSAEIYIPGHPMARYLYAWKVSRQCADDPHCLKAQKPVPDCDRLRMEDLFIGFRAYLEPETRTGPAWGELLYDRAVKFSSGRP